MPLTVAGQNAMVAGLSSVVTHISLHTALSASGASEVTGGTPAYARKAVTWAAASGGTQANSGALTFDVPLGTTVVCAGKWSALTVGTFYGYGGIGANIRTGVATVGVDDVLTSNGHGLVADDRVFVVDVDEALPTGLAEGTIYYVVSPTTDTFQLSATSGGAAVNVTAVGECAWFQTRPEQFGSQGTLTVAAGDCVLDGTSYGTL
jgi:hypothetical protein